MWRKEDADLGWGQDRGRVIGPIEDQERHGESATEGVKITGEKEKPKS